MRTRGGSGGVTTIAVLPNSKPAIDEPALVRLLRGRGEETGQISILPYGALTKGCNGEEMAELGLLREAGAVAFTDGTQAIADTKRMRLLLSYAHGIGAMVVQHPEDPSLARGGCATGGALATQMGLPQIPAAAEAILIARDIRLAEMTGARLHFGHVSTAEGLALIRAAKGRGLPVTCDTAPPYFALNEDEIRDFRTYAKLSPRFAPSRIVLRYVPRYRMAPSTPSPPIIRHGMPTISACLSLRPAQAEQDWRRCWA